MGTENDRFAQDLGRGFKRIWGGLAAGQDMAVGLGRYIDRTFCRDDEDIDAFCRGRQRALDASEGLLFRDLGLDDAILEREGHRSHAAMHAGDAYRDALIRRGTPEDYPRFLADRLFDTYLGLAKAKFPYCNDTSTLSKLESSKEAVTADLCQRLRTRCGMNGLPVKTEARVVVDQQSILNSPVGYTA